MTHQASPSGFDEKAITTIDGGQITFDVDFIPTDATHGNTTGLVGVFQGRLLRTFRVVHTDAGPTRWTATCYVADITQVGALKGVLTSTITLEITGKPVLA